ncbi:thermospermine synthase ACAULIS5-like [Abrus precatorius]|uniref:thermospermine synthase n=1 Tax=Abrus precatorius TaxID=3816 RepID=A0A8B8K3Y7_ABRPR|nr:thermospermine synthase ACAULIS5-like [Abrus precatorius]
MTIACFLSGAAIFTVGGHLSYLNAAPQQARIKARKDLVLETLKRKYGYIPPQEARRMARNDLVKETFSNIGFKKHRSEDSHLLEEALVVVGIENMDSSSIMSSLLRALTVLLFPMFLTRNEHYFELELLENYMEMEIQEQREQNEPHEDEPAGQNTTKDNVHKWFEQEIDSNVKWCLALNRVVFQGASEFQNLIVLATKRFGQALVIDGHLQNTEMDEYIYHESLVHPALLMHNEPKTVFIMGGGGGSAAREVLKHNDIKKVIICDIDSEIANWSRRYMTSNHEALNDERLRTVYNDAKDELEKSEERFDVIVGDLPDPNESKPCNSLYTKSFYGNVVKPKLKENGIFVTQAGPAGILTHKAVFSPIYNTIKQVFSYVIAYTALVPSYGDSYGWIMASDEPMNLDAEQLNNRIGERIRGELSYLDGPLIVAQTVLNKTLKNSLKEETRILTEENENVGFMRQRGVRSEA